jgi:hypothetical protein
MFQAAIIFLYNAKGENQFVKEQGIRYLIKCSRVYLSDPFLRNTRVVKVLQRLVRNFDVPMTESQPADSPVSEASVGNRRKREESYNFESTIPNQHQQAIQKDQHNSYICNAITQSLKSYHHTDHLPILKHSKTSNNDSNTFTVLTGSLNNGTCDRSSNSPARTPSPHILDPFNTTATWDRPSSTSAEDMFFSTLTMGLGKSTELAKETAKDNNAFIDFSNNHEDPVLCPMQQVLDLGPCTNNDNSNTVYSSNSVNSLISNTNNNSDIHQQSPNRPSNTTTPGADFNTSQCFQQLQQSYIVDPIQQFDFGSLSSDIPVWDVPSGISWDEWDSFLKANVYSANN